MSMTAVIEQEEREVATATVILPPKPKELLRM
jgi:hypothetical protein